MLRMLQMAQQLLCRLNSLHLAVSTSNTSSNAAAAATPRGLRGC
jgi:hypothetical protein